MWRAACTCLLFLGLIVSPNHAQRDTTARIDGTVRSSTNGLPIPGVMIAVRGLGALSVSDSAGVFALAGLPAGRRTVRVTYGDTLSYDQALSLSGGQTLTLSVLLDLEGEALSPIVVEARSLLAERTLAGFYERKKWGFGRFYSLADLDRRRALSLRTLLIESGVQVSCRLGRCLPLGGGVARGCVMALFLDGVRLSSDDLETLWLDELAGVEVYKHAFEVPIEFQTPFGGDCGAILMWSRY